MNFKKRKFSLLILAISLLLLIYTFYKSEFYWDGIKRDYYSTYYIISLILIFFSIITFFINKKIREYITISTISFVLSLYLFEGYLTFKEQQSKTLLIKEQFLKEQLYIKKTKNYFDKRNRYQVYKELQKKNNKIVVTVSPDSFLTNNFSIFPLSSVSNVETIHCNENGYYTIYESDRYGFNNPDNEWDKKEIEYFLVGDSFTHGNCVNRPNDIASILRNLSNKSVLNLGYSGFGPLAEFAVLREYLNINVKKVLWIYFEGNDLGNLKNEKSNIILSNYLNDLTFNQNLKLKQNKVNDLTINYIKKEKELHIKNIIQNNSEKTFKFRLLKFIKIFKIRSLLYNRLPPKSLPVSEFKLILKLTKELVKKNNSELYFVYLPQYSRFNTNYDNTNYNRVKKIINELKIPFIDISKEVFEKEQNPLKLFPFELPGHYNIDGYKKVAGTIYKFTKD